MWEQPKQYSYIILVESEAHWNRIKCEQWQRHGFLQGWRAMQIVNMKKSFQIFCWHNTTNFNIMEKAATQSVENDLLPCRTDRNRTETEPNWTRRRTRQGLWSLNKQMLQHLVLTPSQFEFNLEQRAVACLPLTCARWQRTFGLLAFAVLETKGHVQQWRLCAPFFLYIPYKCLPFWVRLTINQKCYGCCTCPGR